MSATAAPRRMRALLVSWLFPPHASIGAKRAYRFARHLPALGWDVTVLCGRAPPARMLDPTPRDLPAGVRVIEDYDAAWFTALANRADARATTPAAPTRPPSPLARRVRSLVADVAHDALPTETIAVHLPHALAVADRIARDQRPDVVWTTSYPYSAHLLGVALRRRHGVPFVADLRDPWTLNFAHDRKYAPARWVERKLESMVFSSADAIVVTSETLARAYGAMHPDLAARIHTVRNAFDPMALPPRARSPGPLRLVHFGHVYGARTMAPVIEALARVRASRRLEPSDLLLENFGRLPDAELDRARALGVADLIRSRDALPYADGIASLRGAGMLVLLAWGTERGGLFVPGKLYDYLLAGVPILGVGRNDEVEEILRKTSSGSLLDPDDVPGIARAIVASLDGRQSDPDAEAVAEFSAPRATAALASVFDQVVHA